MESRAAGETTVDSFRFLWSQIEQECRNLITDAKDVLAVIGALYVARKTYCISSTLLEAAYVHLLGERHTNWVEKFGPWAVVTGSSEGIGLAYAHELAHRGLNIVLISRSEKKLTLAKSLIDLDCKVQVECVVADFAAENQAELYNTITEKLADKEIGLLVNNVGVMYDYPDAVLNVSQKKLWQLIYVNIGAATMMTHMLLPAMVERGKGGVVVVSSGSSTQITPQMTVYSATKRYLDYFIQGTAYEYRKSGVTFQCLVPFYAATRMTGYSQRLSKSSIFVPDAARYAKSAVTSLGKSFITPGYFPHTIQLWMLRLIPSWLYMWALTGLNKSLRREALKRRSQRIPKTESAEGMSDQQEDQQ